MNDMEVRKVSFMKTLSRMFVVSILFLGGCAQTLEPTNVDRTAQVQFSHDSGEYFNAINVVLASETPDAVIYYTMDGSTPTESSLVYSSAVSVSVSADMTLNALATSPNLLPSLPTGKIYTFNYTQVATPEFSVNAGTYAEVFDVEITSATSDARIYYTTGEEDPTDESELCDEEEENEDGNCEVHISGATVLKAIAYNDSLEPSDVASVEYVFDGMTLLKKNVQAVKIRIDFDREVDGRERIRLEDGTMNIIHEYWQKPSDPVVCLADSSGNCLTDPESKRWEIEPFHSGDGERTCYFGDSSAPMVTSCWSQAFDLVSEMGIDEALEGEFNRIANLEVVRGRVDEVSSCLGGNNSNYACITDEGEIKFQDGSGGDTRWTFTFDYFYTTGEYVAEAVPDTEIALARVDFDIRSTGKDILNAEEGLLSIFNDEGSLPVSPAVVSVERWTGTTWEATIAEDYDWIWEASDWDSVYGGRMSPELSMGLSDLIDGEFDYVANLDVLEARQVRCQENGAYTTYSGSVSLAPEGAGVVLDSLSLPSGCTLMNDNYRVSFEYFFTVPVD